MIPALTATKVVKGPRAFLQIPSADPITRAEAGRNPAKVTPLVHPQIPKVSSLTRTTFHGGRGSGALPSRP
jgi:hypothetical protein